MKTQSRQDRLSFMCSHGLNTPLFVENPSSKYKENTVTFLKELFPDVEYFTFLAKKDSTVREFDEEPFRDAFQKSVVLEQNGYTVWIVEGVGCEYTGTIWARKDGSGKFKYREGAERRLAFTDCEALEKTRERIIARRVVHFVNVAGFSAVQVDFGWAKSFTGSYNERIVFFDFLPLKSFT